MMSENCNCFRIAFESVEREEGGEMMDYYIEPCVTIGEITLGFNDDSDHRHHFHYRVEMEMNYCPKCGKRYVNEEANM